MARFAPFFLANALFRICAFALIIVFLDWWSVIPFALLLLLNLVRHCIITTIMQSSLSREDFSYFSTMVSHSLCPAQTNKPGQKLRHHNNCATIKYSQVVFGLSFRRFTSTSSPPASDHSLSALELNRLSTMEVLRHISLHMFSIFFYTAFVSQPCEGDLLFSSLLISDGRTSTGPWCKC